MGTFLTGQKGTLSKEVQHFKIPTKRSEDMQAAKFMQDNSANLVGLCADLPEDQVHDEGCNSEKRG
jgi:hypothetical protein